MAPRADTLLAERGLFESRAKAREAIEAGLVRADGRLVKKPSEDIATDARVSATAPYPWVSRGGVKLAHALENFGVDPRGRYCLDVGASTGGFTDVLLSRGARHVVAVDVGHGQLHPRIRGDARVTVLERLDARALEPGRLAEPPSLIVCDASFISLTLILPNVLALATPEATLITLIKPQFEAGRAAAKKGVVRDALVHRQVCARIAQEVERLGWRIAGLCPSPIEGGDGNREFLLCGQKS
jgi:23S rRNA (cytidine1920-2'-O)/16S rRNA (cytidine1409-2'-O)-methyltransferase